MVVYRHLRPFAYKITLRYILLYIFLVIPLLFFIINLFSGFISRAMCFYRFCTACVVNSNTYSQSQKYCQSKLQIWVSIFYITTLGMLSFCTWTFCQGVIRWFIYYKSTLYILYCMICIWICLFNIHRETALPLLFAFQQLHTHASLILLYCWSFVKSCSF